MAAMGRLGGVEIFIQAAKAASFTAAAAHLGLSKSAVAKAVAQLEARLGVKLFHRTTRRLSLTPEGESYFAQCEAAIEQIRAAEDAARDRTTAVRGVLRVDMPAAFGRRVALPILLDILRAHPELRLEASFSDRIIDPVEEGVDLCLRFGELPDRGDLAARRLGSQRLVLTAAPSYLARHPAPETLAELKAHACIVGSRPGRPASWRFCDEEDRPVAVEPEAAHLCSDGDAVIAMAVAGFGLCQMPQSLLQPFIAAGQLQPVFETFSQVETPFHAVWPLRRQMLPRVRVVVDELVRRAAEGAF